jgi:hypothetical protein
MYCLQIGRVPQQLFQARVLWASNVTALLRLLQLVIWHSHKRAATNHWTATVIARKFLRFEYTALSLNVRTNDNQLYIT